MPDIPTVPTPEDNENTTPPVVEPVVPAPVIPVVTTEADPSVSESEEESSVEEALPTEEQSVEEKKSTKEKQKEEKPMAPPKPKKPATQILITVLAIVLGLIAIIYIFLLWAIVEGDFSSTQFTQFLDIVGMDAISLKKDFMILTHILFGGISFIFLIAALIKFFQWIMTSATSMYKTYHLKKMGVFVLIIALLVGIWVGIIWIVSGADVDPPMKDGNTEHFIKTQPENLYLITAPITVTFDIGTLLFEKIGEDLIREIRWDFDGDGKSDAGEPIVTHRFLDRGENEGRYKVKVEVVYLAPNVNEERTYTETVDVVISNVAISAVMTASPEVGSVPLTVKFSADKSVDLDGEIIQYEWDLDGDGEFELRGPNRIKEEHVFYTIGEHQVRLRVTGRNNDFSIDEKVITVIAEEQKVRAEIVSQDSAFEGMAPMSITFNGGTSFTQSGKIVKYEWRVDGEPEPFLGREMHRTFNTEGEYKVELLVENSSGDRDTVTQIVKVESFREMNIVTSPKKDTDDIVHGTTPFEVTFDSTKSEIPDAVEWKWDFEGDDIIDSRNQTATHVFRKAGTYDVKLIIVDANDREFTKTQRVVVEKLGVLAQISATPSSGTVPLTVEFDGSGSLTVDETEEIIDYIWTFPGEAPIHYNAKISREFRQVGVFPVKLEILTSDGKRAEKEIFISVRGQVLQAAFDVDPMAGAAPLKVRFRPMSSTGNIQSYFWTFGDGSVSTDAYPTHTFTYKGEFPVKLKITDSRGIVSTFTKNVTVTAEGK